VLANFAKKSLSGPMIFEDILVLAQLISDSFPNFSTCVSCVNAILCLMKAELNQQTELI
jgi:hypothetical protein